MGERPRLLTTSLGGADQKPATTDPEVAELLRLAAEADAELTLTEERLDAALADLAARAELVREIAAIDRERPPQDEPKPARKERRARRENAVDRLAALRSLESDLRLEDREAWALAEREMARASVRRAIAGLDAYMQRMPEGEVESDGATERESPEPEPLPA